MVRVGRELCGSPSPTPCPSRVTQSRLHSSASRWGLKISREGDLKKFGFSSKMIAKMELFFPVIYSFLNPGSYIYVASCISIKEFVMLLNLNS